MKENKMSIIIAVIIFIAVIAFLIFITINKEEPITSQPVETEQVVETEQKNMDNTQQNTQNIKQPEKRTLKIEGVDITVLKEGSGNPVKSGDTVAMNYTGKLKDGTVFDSNIDPKFGHIEPFVFTIGAGNVIKGWDVGIAGMKLGEKRILEIRSDYAYGSAAVGPIPPNSNLTFEVELLGIKK